MGAYSINVYEGSFRLIADGATLEPSTYPNEVIAPYSAKDLAVGFEIPDQTKSLELQVGMVGEKTNRFVINMQSLLNQRKPTSPEQTTRRYPVRLETGAEARAGDETYKILSAELERHSDGMMATRFKMQVANGGQYAINVSESNFRLLADGVPRAPEKAPSEVLAGGSSIDVDVLFVIAETTAAIELQVGQVGKYTTRMPINIR
jgi:hypothetical protein